METKSTPAGPERTAQDDSQLWLGALAVGALPVLKLWQLAGNPVAEISAVALIVLLAWWLGGMLARRAPRANRPELVIAAAGLAGWSWMLGWLWPSDFWFVRWAFVMGGVLVTMLLWGWRGPVFGIRLIIALALWLVVPVAEQWQRLPSAWLCDRTAAGSAFLLWETGFRLTRAGATIYLERGALEVEPGCTALPIWAVLTQMLIVVALLFRISWRRVVLLSVVLAVASFGISVVRIAFMAPMLKNPVRFNYWHGAEGGSWFTAAGMLLLAALVKRSLDMAGPDDHPVPVVNFASDHARFIRWSAMLPLAGVALALASANKAAPAMLAVVPEPPPGYRMVVDETQRPGDQTAPNGLKPFLWMRHVIYDSPRAGAQIEARLAYAPSLLSGDPTVAPLTYHWLTDRPGAGIGVERGPTGEPAREVLGPGRVTWMVTLPLAGGAVATQAGWEEQLAKRNRHPSAWLEWLSGQAPLHDKRAYWLVVTWRGTGEEGPADAASTFAAWREAVRVNARSL